MSTICICYFEVNSRGEASAMHTVHLRNRSDKCRSDTGIFCTSLDYHDAIATSADLHDDAGNLYGTTAAGGDFGYGDNIQDRYRRYRNSLAQLFMVGRGKSLRSLNPRQGG